MNITEVKIKLMNNRSDRLRAFCSITVDNDFVIRDLRIIEGAKGTFVAMPSRKLTDKCQKCGTKNHLRARFCNNCGFRLNEDRAVAGPKARAKFHVDIAHPINSRCRQEIQEKVLSSFQDELERSKLPGYKPADAYEPDDYYADESETSETGLGDSSSPPPLQSHEENPGNERDFGEGIA